MKIDEKEYGKKQPIADWTQVALFMLVFKKENPT